MLGRTEGNAQVDCRVPETKELRLPYQEWTRLKKLAQRRVKKREEKVEKVMVLGALNVGSMTGSSMELLRKGILEVNRESDRLMSIKIQVDNVVIDIASTYVPQIGSDEGEKDEFWDKLRSVIQSVPSLEVPWVCGGLNGHVGEGNKGSSDCMGKHGVDVRNEDGDRIVDWTTAGVSPVESVAKQHSPLVCKIKENCKGDTGENFGGKKEGKETWWWNEGVQMALKRKKEYKKDRDHNRTEEAIKAFKEANKIAKWAVAKAKAIAYEDM
ncbi:uncharacterized protein LOC122257418 [Penaeus japonicus]|uniref:uncharacterized protein LOC122257418 n=1 Tax=Penaeus japonicus TaxID=27405 RepID=UPI001C70E8DC|nr:uncharacterized protein LOC122257418 [Penaeus japonicus]